MCLNEICKQLLVSYTHSSTYTYEYLIKEFYEKINVVNDVYILENIILNDENWGFTIEVYMVLFSKLKLLNFDSEQAELKYYSFLSMYMDNCKFSKKSANYTTKVCKSKTLNFSKVCNDCRLYLYYLIAYI